MTRTTHEQQAYDMGRDAALAAASWIIDGNTDQEHIARLLAMLDNGDPQAEHFMPRAPNLSGEWADAPTPSSLYESITGRELPAEGDEGLDFETLHGSTIDVLANAFEAGVLDTFDAECERILRAALDDES